MSITKLKWAAVASFLFAIGFLLYGGWEAKDQLAPYPGEVAGPGGEALFTKDDILAGQAVFQRYGLMDHGSVWGHGSQRGMEFSATALRMIGLAARERIAESQYGRAFEELEPRERQVVEVLVAAEVKENRYDPSADRLTLTENQLLALERSYAFWETTFRDGESRYGFLPNTVPTEQERRQLSRFFFWTAWAAGTFRPDQQYTYTNNWPADRLVGNVPTPEIYLWSLGGLLSLFFTLGLFIWMVHRFEIWYGRPAGVPLSDKLVDMPLTPSQAKATKFFLVVVLLFLAQTTVGGLLAHYTVSPRQFYFQSVADIIPYSWAKSWHLQLAIFWIATTWIATAIYLAPIIGGREPRKQALLVQLLFGAIILVAVGSLIGEVAGIKGMLGKLVVLARAPGLGVPRAGPAVANPAVRRADLLAGHHLPGAGASPHGRPGPNRYSELIVFYMRQRDPAWWASSLSGCSTATPPT